MLSRLIDCGPVRHRFLAKVRRAGPEELEALDKGAVAGEEDVCSEALAFLRDALPKAKKGEAGGRRFGRDH